MYTKYPFVVCHIFNCDTTTEENSMQILFATVKVANILLKESSRRG